MGCIFGIHNTVERQGYELELAAMSRHTQQFAPDGIASCVDRGIGMAVQPYFTHPRSRLDARPQRDSHDNLIVFDGRLDNHRELRERLGLAEADVSDSAIVLSAFARWGAEGFSFFVGDWALAIWSSAEQTLTLARDHAGTRPLYYMAQRDQIRWSTHLETLVLNGGSQRVDHQFLACFLAGELQGNRSPYEHIKAVLPGHSVVWKRGRATTQRHWSWEELGDLPNMRDAEYDEHFLSLLEQAVERRVAPADRVVAHLSGGMDSTSIVVLADRARVRISEPPVQTLSIFSDDEQDSNERPYVVALQEHRGRSGIGISTSSLDSDFGALDESRGPWLLPGFDRHRAGLMARIDERLSAEGCRAVIAGTGGDELLGGVPNPLPELADTLLNFRIGAFVGKSIQWGLPSRTPLIHSIHSTLQFLAGLYFQSAWIRSDLPSWLTRQGEGLLEARKDSGPIGISSFGRRPSSAANERAWWATVETLPHLETTPFDRREFRYPFLDRNLVEFLLRVPRNQLLRPGRRRYLMRRALKDIVPDFVLERKRKGVVTRGPLQRLAASLQEVQKLLERSLLQDIGIVDVQRLTVQLTRTVELRDPTSLRSILRTVQAEQWLRSSVANSRIAL